MQVTQMPKGCQQDSTTLDKWFMQCELHNQDGNIATLTTLSGLRCLIVLDFVQKVPFTHENIPLPFIYIVPSQLLLYHCQLMAHLSQQSIRVEINH